MLTGPRNGRSYWNGFRHGHVPLLGVEAVDGGYGLFHADGKSSFARHIIYVGRDTVSARWAGFPTSVFAPLDKLRPYFAVLVGGI